MLNSSSLAAQLNMSYWPVPDCDWPNGNPTKCDRSIGGKRACACDDVEVCAVRVTGCLGGCSGPPLVTLSQFIGCFAGKKEGTCGPDSKATLCAASSGLNETQLTACLADRKMMDGVYRTVWAHGKRIRAFPAFFVSGKKTKAETPVSIKKALCKAGAQAAC